MRFGETMLAAVLAMAVEPTLAGSDAHHDFVQMNLENGFASESYTVISDDGYVYQLYRIPGKVGEKKTEKPAVLMMHGLECDMNFWLPNDPEVVPPYVLAEQGYDVWLGNNRGTRYASYHTTLDPKEAEYWQFSQETMGMHDLPTFIDHIIETTGQEKITYVGHSQGTTQMFIAGSLDPEYFNAKVNLFVALGPVTSLNNVNVPAMRMMSKNWRETEYLALKFGAYNLLDANWIEEEATQLFCGAAQGVCEMLLQYVADADTSVDNLDRYSVFLKDFPAGNGWGNLVHYAQGIVTVGEWLRFDYGGIKNMDHYGTLVPPKVPLEQLGMPTALFVGSYDNLATVKDNEWLTTQLNPDVLVWKEVYPLGHMSFSLAKDMSFFTVDAMNLINQYATNSFAQKEEDELFLATN